MAVKQFVLFYILIFFSNTFILNATHLRGGYIHAEITSSASLTYQVNLVLLTDMGSSVVGGGGEIDFGDGTVMTDLDVQDQIIDSERQLGINRVVIEHTYQGPGSYTISYSERGRNAGVMNISNSVDTPFYIETTILIDPFLGSNSNPNILNPSFTNWFTGTSGHFNLAALDPDGDSLSYRLGIPRQSKDKTVVEYTKPDNAIFYGTEYSTGNEEKNDIPKFELDPISGDLIWDAPSAEGEYTALVIVDEWRWVHGERYKIGTASFDIQMIVEEDEVLKPTIVFPENQCYQENSIVEELFQVDGHTPVKVNLHTDAEGAKIDNIPIEEYDFDLWKNSFDLTFTYDSKNAAQEYYKIVLSLEQESVTGPNYFWSKAFVFGLGCDEIVRAPVIVTSLSPVESRLSTNAYLTHSSGRISITRSEADQVDFQLFDLNGKSLVKEKISLFEGKGQVRYDPIPSGIYIAFLEIESHLYKQKVLVR
jgi:hypothetical protein